ncbi:hypothetical protein MKW98_014193, partial [Papaver atlanticum]
MTEPEDQLKLSPGKVSRENINEIETKIKQNRRRIAEIQEKRTKRYLLLNQMIFPLNT